MIIAPRYHKQLLNIYTIDYSLFADADTGICPQAAPLNLSRPKAKCGIASVVSCISHLAVCLFLLVSTQSQFMAQGTPHDPA